MRCPAALLTLAMVLSPVVARGAQECGPTPYACAMFHVGRAEFTTAISLLEPLLAQTPADLKVLNLAGIALTGAGRVVEGNARFRDAIQLDTTFYPALKNLAVNEFNAGRIGEAQRLFEDVLNLAPDDEITHLHLGEIETQRKNFAAALTHYQKSADRVLQNPGWMLHFASCLVDQQMNDKAAALLEKLPDSDAESRFEAGMILGKAGMHAQAARFFATTRERYKDPYAAGYNQTLMLVEAGEFDAAIRVGQELFDRGSKPAELYSLVARAYLKAGRVKEAYDSLRTAIQTAPASEDHYVDLASICLDHQNFDLGLEIIDIGLRQRPDSSLLHLQRGALMAMRAELGTAETEFEAARRLAPDQSAPYAGLAMIWMQTGQADKAVDILRTETQRRSDHVLPYIFAVALMRAGVDPAGPDAIEAVDALHASIRVNPRFAPSHSELGRLLLKRDDLDGAIRELENATALDGGNTVAMYNLAQAYRKKGDRARAGDLLARLTRLNAQQHGDDPAGELKRTMISIVREGSAPRR
jgi:tetratricopeptide (TPR) repeat protein